MSGYLPRLASRKLEFALSDTPVIVVQGPRQCGKSTMVQEVCSLPYVTLDDPIALEQAFSKPAEFLRTHPKGMIIDEVQRAPQLARAVKAHIDKDRRPGQFVLTGSANILLLPKLSDSLAGRMEVIQLYPFAQSELAGSGHAFIDELLEKRELPDQFPDVSLLNQFVFDGGYPPSVSRKDDARKTAWQKSYVKALIEKDVRDLSSIEGLALMPKLLRLVAEKCYEVQNISALCRETGLPHTTLTRYLQLLDGVFITQPIPAYTETKKGKAAKSSRTAFIDTGLLASLTGWSKDKPMTRSMLENFITMEFVKQATWIDEEVEVMHFRSLRQYSVPIVLKLPSEEIVGIQPILSEFASPSDLTGLQFLQDIAGEKFAKGVILTLGKERKRLTEKFEQMPVSALWA